MNIYVKLKQWALLIGDVVVFYLALALALYIKYGSYWSTATSDHFTPFTYIFFIWLIIFYISGLYDIIYTKNNLIFIKRLGSALTVNALLTVIIFYLLPLSITPKTNLLLILIAVFTLEYVWRYLFNKVINSAGPSANVLLIGSNETTNIAAERVKNNPQMGFALKFWIKKNKIGEAELEHINQIIIAEKINLIVIPNHLKKDSLIARAIYRNLALGIETLDIVSFYEIIFGKIPLDELEEVWFLENLNSKHRVYESLKQPLEIILALALIIILSPLIILIALLVKLTSSGPAIYQQIRVGQYGANFTLYKFRTMIKDAEIGGAQWAKPNDQRTTFIGQILRYSHLDELPQLFNILEGNVSFIGPRPERPEFTEKLKEEIVHYDLRHLARPGISGWAQVKYRYGASVNDAREKLQYDLYYLKNRSFWLDLSIILRTIKLLIIQNR